LIFWASAEIFQPASAAMNAVRQCVEPFLNFSFAASSLQALEVKLRYVPIIMPEGMRERYPARSKLRKKERLYDCAPQLNYDVFVEGRFEDQPHEYLRGIGETTPHLAALGATPQQIEDFENIMSTAVERILIVRPEQIRH
jgi:hypothetical protein